MLITFWVSISRVISQYPVPGYIKTKQQTVLQCKGGRSFPQPLFLGAHLSAAASTRGFKELATCKFSGQHSDVVHCCLNCPTAISQQKRYCPRHRNSLWELSQTWIQALNGPLWSSLPALRQDQLYQLCKPSTKWGVLLALPVILTLPWHTLSGFLLACIFALLKAGSQTPPLSQLFCTWGWSVQVTCCIFLQIFWPQVPLEAQAHLVVSTRDPGSQGDCRQWPPGLVSGSERSARSELSKDGIPPIKITHNERLQNRYQHTMKQTGSQAQENQTYHRSSFQIPENLMRIWFKLALVTQVTTRRKKKYLVG